MVGSGLALWRAAAPIVLLTSAGLRHIAPPPLTLDTFTAAADPCFDSSAAFAWSAAGLAQPEGPAARGVAPSGGLGTRVGTPRD